MTSDPTWTPSEGLVEAVADCRLAIATGGVSGLDNMPESTAAWWTDAARRELTAAVAYRRDGHPELVPWEQVRDGIESPEVLRAIEAALNTAAHDRHAGLHVSDQEEAVRVMRAVARAALAPFTQEPR